MGQVTPPKQGVTPTTGLDMVTMIHSLQNEVCDLLEYGVGGNTYVVVKVNYSPFMAQIMADICTENFMIPNPAPYDGKADPAYHI